MGRKVHLQHSRQIPSFFVSADFAAGRIRADVIRAAPITLPGPLHA